MLVRFACGAMLFVVSVLTTPAAAQWLQWGGPNRDFKIDGKGISTAWSESGPKKLWDRELGKGYSGILVDGDTLYTMYRSGDQERIIALSALNGRTLWETGFKSVPPSFVDTKWGTGPNTTPIVHDDRVYAFGFNAYLLCVDKKTGKPVWQHDLVEEFGAKVLYYGHAASPIVFRDMIIVFAGGDTFGAMAFKLGDGTLVWKAEGFAPSYASPVITRIDGVDQMINAVSGEVVGVDPATGKLLWKAELKNQWNVSLMSPILLSDQRVFVCSHEDGGKALHLSSPGAAAVANEQWKNKAIQVAHSNAVYANGCIFGSTGARVNFLMAVDANSGKVLWKTRDIGQVNLLHLGGDRFLLLDEEGSLAITKLTAEGPSTLAKTKLFDGRSWTAPTLVGTRLYTRDLKRIVALAL